MTISTEEEDRAIAEKILGAMEVPDDYASGPEWLAWLKEPFKKDWAVAYCFCDKCVAMIEVGIESVAQLCRIARVNVPTEYRGVHFIVTGCPFCQEDGCYRNARIIHIYI
ncbi:MAG: hypothetical protein JW943_02365 [Deltaproteobacteria bacterium]|nr:hypothetical protein [Deltaproteobacteria bacterium]